MAEAVVGTMTDERDESEQSRELLGTPPPIGATFEEPTGADAVVAREEATITDGGVVKPEEESAEGAPAIPGSTPGTRP